MKKLLLLSNSTLAGQVFLEFAKPEIASFLGPKRGTLVFIPFAAVTFGYGQYTQKVQEALGPLGYSIVGIQDSKDPTESIASSDGILVGGGNTFHLLNELYQRDLLEVLSNSANDGIPYIGWSAGSNLACPTIRTTNDMPIVEPPSLRSLGIVDFQINPHYTEDSIPHHSGETREARILEYLEANPEQTVIGIPEGTLIRMAHGEIIFKGSISAKLFQKDREPIEIQSGENLSPHLGLAG